MTVTVTVTVTVTDHEWETFLPGTWRCSVCGSLTESGTRPHTSRGLVFCHYPADDYSPEGWETVDIPADCDEAMVGRILER